MGYTHYWERRRSLSSGWSLFIRDCRIALNNLPEHTDIAGGFYVDKPLRICGPFGKGRPILSKDVISFNGCGIELEHETFRIPRVLTASEIKKSHESRPGFYFNFCKTARKPYDLMVVSCLLLAKKHFRGKIRISSDGDASDHAEAYDYLESLGLDVNHVRFGD